MLREQRVASLLLVIEADVAQRPQRRRMTHLALLRAEQLTGVRTLVALLATAVERRQLERRLRVALRARDVGMRPFEWHRSHRLVVVIEVERCLLWFPRARRVAATALLVAGTQLTVLVVLRVARAAGLLGIDVDAQPLRLVGRGVALRAVGL